MDVRASMLVFGDCIEPTAPLASLDALEGKRSSWTRMETAAHADVISAFVLASEHVQGILDAEFSAASEDIDSPARSSATRLMMTMARCVQWSWEGRCGANPFGEMQSAIAELRALPLPHRVPCKRAEGFAFYSLYPESYLQAAAGLATSERWRVVGIRSIGTGLAALVSAGLGAGPPILVRPVGENAQRRLALSPAIAKALIEDSVDRFAIVDEGPGLSGGSFGCVADYLEQHGIACERIGFFPSHPGDLGILASEVHRRRWRTVNRYYIGFDQLTRPSDGRSLCAMICDPIGVAQKPLIDVSAGNWRAHRFADPNNWPAVNMTEERRKYLLYSEDGPYLLSSEGWGTMGQPSSHAPSCCLKRGSRRSSKAGLTVFWQSGGWPTPACRISRPSAPRSWHALRIIWRFERAIFRPQLAAAPRCKRWVRCSPGPRRICSAASRLPYAANGSNLQRVWKRRFCALPLTIGCNPGNGSSWPMAHF
jgi:hypothetical protein